MKESRMKGFNIKEPKIKKAAYTKRSKAREKGFTLLELLISMGLTALLLSMLSAGVYSVVNDWQRETSVLDDTLEEALVLLQIERALFSAFPHSYVDPERLARFVYFDGLDDSLSWVSTVSPQRTTGLMVWTLQSDDREGLFLTLTPAFSDHPQDRIEEATPVSILENYRAEFRYLFQRNEQEKEWLDEWAGEEMQSLPLAVHIVLSPIDENINEQGLEILAPIKNFRHEDIAPTTPLI